MFEISSLPWISAALGQSIRLTVSSELLPHLAATEYSGLQQDTLFGEGPIAAHLYLSWAETVEGRKYGHYDLLTPSSKETSLMLLLDEAWLEARICSDHCAPKLHYSAFCWPCTWTWTIKNISMLSTPCKCIYIYCMYGIYIYININPNLLRTACGLHLDLSKTF